MENDYLLDTNMEAISPPSSPSNQSPNSFSRDLIGHLGITSQGSETVIYETQNMDNYCFSLWRTTAKSLTTLFYLNV